MPGIKVELSGEKNGFRRTAVTTDEGFFSFPDLTPSTFTLVIEMPGFKAYRETGIAVESGQQRSMGQIRLQLGQVSESVTVSAEAVTLNVTTGEKAGTLTGNQLDEIALRGRDVFDAVSLMPGVVDTSDGRDSPSARSIDNIFIMGGRTDQKNMTVDGITNLDTGSNQTVHSMPSMDSVAEVKVLMSAYSAENGRNPSAINVITKGGGKDFHGSAAWYLRNEDFNANNYFSNSAGKPRTEYRYNIGSYTIGGPVRLPKLHVPKNRLFFFFSQEFQRQVVQYGVVEKTVPTALERKGDFSQSVNTNGTLVKVNDPLNNKAQFPGNVIPASRLNPIGQAILNMFPLPNFTDPNPAYQYNWNYYAAMAEPYNRRTETARVDYSPRDNWQLYVSLSNNADAQEVPYNGGTSDSWVAGSRNFPLSPIHFQQPGRLGTLHSTNTIAPSLFNEASFGISQNTLTFQPSDPAKMDRTDLGIAIPQRNPSLNALNLIPDMTFSSIQNYANPSMHAGMPYYNQNTIYSFTDNVSKIWRTHTFKTGIYFEDTQKIQVAYATIRGSLSFNTDGNNPLDANNSYANAILGNYDSYAESTSRPMGSYWYSNTEWFVQDTWKVKPNLSLDYGIRFYHDPPTYDEHNQLSSFSPSAYSVANATVLLRPATVNGAKVALDPTTGKTYPQGLIGDFVPGVGNTANGMLLSDQNGVPRGLFTLPPVSVAPRFGFAYAPRGGKTVIRGGGGVYYDRNQLGAITNMIINPPTVYTPMQYYGTFADIAASASTGYLSPSGTTYSLSGPGHMQTVYNYNLSIQRQLGRSNLMEVGYSGSLGRHLLWERNINPVPLGSNFLNLNPQNRDPTTTSSVLPVNFLRPYQGLGDVYMYEYSSNSNYNALTASVQHRLAHGFNLTASYSFSRALDTADFYSNAVDPFLSPRSWNYGPAGFDRTHVFTTNFFWNLPKPGQFFHSGPLGAVADNWQLSGVVRMQTGGAFTPGYSLINGINSPTGSASEGYRAEVINPTAPVAQRFGPAPEPAGQANVPWTVASTDPQMGDLGKNTMRYPGTNNWDLSIYRTIRIRERANAQIRLESYNTFNHTQFSGVDTGLRFDSTGAQVNTAFDLPTSARPPRRVQIALRLQF